MLDLDLMLNKTIDIKMHGLVKVKQPSFALAKRVRAYEQNIKNMEEEEIYKEQTSILLSFLNNNSSNRKFDEKDIDKLTFKAIRALYNTLVQAIMGAEESPN